MWELFMDGNKWKNIMAIRVFGSHHISTNWVVFGNIFCKWFQSITIYCGVVAHTKFNMKRHMTSKHTTDKKITKKTQIQTQPNSNWKKRLTQKWISNIGTDQQGADVEMLDLETNNQEVDGLIEINIPSNEAIHTEQMTDIDTLDLVFPDMVVHSEVMVLPDVSELPEMVEVVELSEIAEVSVLSDIVKIPETLVLPEVAGSSEVVTVEDVVAVDEIKPLPKSTKRKQISSISAAKIVHW